MAKPIKLRYLIQQYNEYVDKIAILTEELRFMSDPRFKEECDAISTKKDIYVKAFNNFLDKEYINLTEIEE